MRWMCALFGHRLNAPVLNSRGHRSHMTCRRCKTFFLPDYYDGWRRATNRERDFRLRAYHKARLAELPTEQPAE